MDSAKHIEKLPNSPLQEVVFELFWELEMDNNGMPDETDYELALGVFAEKIKTTLPYNIKSDFNISQNVGIRLFPFPRHQFWKGPKTWPVVQIGPGILVVNDVEQNYIWREFRKQIVNAFNALNKAYNKSINFNLVRLKYIDAFEIGNQKMLDFINNNFTISLSNSFGLDKQPEILNIGQRFLFENDGNLDIYISSAFKDPGKPTILWQSIFSREGKITTDEVVTWLDKAHGILSNQFKNFVKPNFYARFTDTKN